MPRGASFDTTMVHGVSESNLYRIKGQPMQTMASSSRVKKVKEKVTLKVV
jgi:hypothetical protein